MRKIYSLVLLAAVLLLGTNVGATTYYIGGSGTDHYASLDELFSAVTLQSGDGVNITTTITPAEGTYDFHGATVTVSNDQKFIGIGDTNGNYIFRNAAFVNNNSTDGTGVFRAATNNARLTLENVTFTNNAGVEVRASTNTTIILKGVSFTNCNNAINVNSNNANGVNIINENSMTFTSCARGINVDKKGTGKVTFTNNGIADFSGCNVAFRINTGITMDIDITNNGTFTAGNANHFDISSINDGVVANITNNDGATMTITDEFTSAKVLKVTNHGTFSIADTNTKDFYTWTIDSDGTATIEGGTYGSTTGVTLTGVTINGGTLNSVVTATNCTIAGGTFQNNVTASMTTISGGTFNHNYGNLITLDHATVNAGTFEVAVSAINSTTINDGTFYKAVSANHLTIAGGTFKALDAVLGGTGITVTGGKFEVAPAANASGTIAGVCQFPAGPAIGGLTIADGYMGLAIGDIIVKPVIPTGTVAMINGSQTFSSIQEAINAAQSGDVIQLIEDVQIFKPLWLGTIHESDAAKSLTLDLNGHSITSIANVYNTFILSHGALTVKNSVPGVGGIYNMCDKEDYCSVFMVHGTYNRGINPRTAKVSDLFTFLSIEEGVDIHADFGADASAIVIQELVKKPSGTAKEIRSEAVLAFDVDYATDVYRNNYIRTYGVANGVRVDVKGHISAKKYGIKVNGNLRYPSEDECDPTYTPTHRATYFSELGDVQEADTAYVPYIHIYESALVEQDETNGKGAAAYASGYAHWFIEGTCDGATGLYAKSGEVTLNDANITSSWTGDTYFYETGTNGQKSGVNSGGNAVVVESANLYPGRTVVIVEGDTKIETEANGGAALFELVNSDIKETKVDSIVIKGGSFTVGEDGYAMVISPTTIKDPETEIVVYGTNATGGFNIGGEEDMKSILAKNVHTTEVTNSDGSKIVIVSTGDTPDAKTEWTDVAALAAGTNVNWTGFTPGEINAGSMVTLGELLIAAGNVTEGVQQLTIENNATLVVDRLIMNDYARIIVEAGGKLIVKGEFGINAPVVENIVLKASETEGQAMFLFHPNVKSNRHPNATVEFISNSITDGGNYSKQRFAIPTFGQLSSMTTTNGGANVQTAMSKFYYDENKWKDFGWINVAGKTENLDQMATPFEYYQMQHNTPNIGTIVTMKGELYGNESPVFDIKGQSWNGYANSYMAPISAEQLIDLIPPTVDKSFQIYEINTLTNKGSWTPVSLLELEDIKPMQAFLIRNTKAAADVNVDYAQAVYYPAMGIVPNSAPVRRAINDMTKAKLIVKGEDCIDRVVVAEGDQFSAEFDNGYDAAKYMNDGINMYVSADEKMSIFATNDLSNTFVGIQTINGGNYTIEFAKVQGKELFLIDHETDAQVAMVEGATYEFTAAANSTNDYRFEIVEPAKLPTAIENTEAVKSAKGVYTITGQYVGEMNVWNTLPAGIYVVNGKKLVK